MMNGEMVNEGPQMRQPAFVFSGHSQFTIHHSLSKTGTASWHL
jgi:hypothetical protein